jgi:hypothetical protein
MSSKFWIERVIEKPAKAQHADPQDKAGKRARLAEALLKMRKEKG